jgi:hypothetical protein
MVLLLMRNLPMLAIVGVLVGACGAGEQRTAETEKRIASVCAKVSQTSAMQHTERIRIFREMGGLDSQQAAVANGVLMLQRSSIESTSPFVGESDPVPDREACVAVMAVISATMCPNAMKLVMSEGQRREAADEIRDSWDVYTKSCLLARGEEVMALMDETLSESMKRKYPSDQSDQ